jgi:hypothetical protein
LAVERGQRRAEEVDGETWLDKEKNVVVVVVWCGVEWCGVVSRVARGGHLSRAAVASHDVGEGRGEREAQGERRGEVG